MSQTLAKPLAQDDVVESLRAAANTAHSAFLAAAAIDPAKAKPLWVDSIVATNAYLTALDQTLQGDPADIQKAQSALDAATQDIENSLGQLQDVVTAITAVSKLLNLITSVARFFVGAP